MPVASSIELGAADGNLDKYKVWTIIVDYTIVNDVRNFVFGLAGAAVYGSCKSRKQKFVMSFTIAHGSKERR